MNRFVQDLRFSVRTLRKSPGFSLTAILTLGVGIGAVTAIFSVVDSVLLQPFSFPAPDRLVILRESLPQFSAVPLPDNPMHFATWRDGSKTMADAALIQTGSASLATGTGHPEIVNSLKVDPHFFNVLGVQPALGRAFLPGETLKGHNNVVILSWEAWQRYFHGDTAVMGKTLRNGGQPETVVGVMSRSFHFPRMSEMPGAVSQNAAEPYTVFHPLLRDEENTDDGNYNYLAIGRLRPEVPLEQARTELNTLQAVFDQAHKLPVRPVVVVEPLIVEVAGGVSAALWLLLAAVGAVLLIGCVNLANLQLARAVSRERELSVRAALGAGRDRLIAAALSDSLVLAAMGGALGLGLAFAGVRLFVAAAPQNLPRLSGIQISWPVLLGAAGLSILTALFFGLLPALRSMRVDPQAALQTRSTRVSSSRESRRTRHLLVAAEVACTVALLIVTALLIRSFSRLLTQNRDFDASRVTLAAVYLYAPQYSDSLKTSEAARAAFMDRALDALATIPGVQSVASTSERPMAGDTWVDDVTRPDRPVPEGQEPHANIRWISPGYAATLRIPVVEGRDLRADDRNHPANALISARTARAIWPGEDPIGHTFQINPSTKFTVVGVLADARINDLRSTANMIYIPYWQQVWFRPNFLIRSTEATAGLAPAIQRTLWKIDPEVAIPVLKSLDQQVSESVATERFQTLLLTSFGAAALLLALLGIYGVLSYSVSLRRQELGIRIALGSSKSSLMRLIARQAATPIAGGILAGIALALAATRWVQSLLYETSGADPVAVTVSVGLLLLTALLAVTLPAWRAAQTDPMQVLRNE